MLYNMSPFQQQGMQKILEIRQMLIMLETHLLLAQEEALEALYGLIARVNKNAEAKRELTVAGPKGKEFEECAEEANSSSPKKD